MPLVKNQVFRIKIIDELLSRKQWVKTSEMKKVIEGYLMEEISPRTIQTDIEDMKSDTRLGYNAPIEYDSRKKAYMYTDPDFSINNFSLTSEEINALQFYAECLQIFSGYKLFDSYTSGIQKVIKGVSFRNKIRPQSDPKKIIQTDSLIFLKGQEYLEQLVYAIDHKYKIRVAYKPYYTDEAETRELLPLYLKEYKNRWYLLGYKFEEDKIKTYALDRITSVEITEDICENFAAFDPEIFFKHSFGITTPEGKVETIVLKFNNEELFYVKSLPIHPTQQIISEDADSIMISIQVTLSYELFEFILGKTPNVTVLSPSHVIKEIGSRIVNGKKNYKIK